MKLRITMPNGITKEKEFAHKDEIEIALKRGWKEVPSDKKVIKEVEPKADGAKIIKKAKKKSKKKMKKSN